MRKITLFCRGIRPYAPTVILALLLTSQAWAEDEDRFSGYYKNLFTTTKTAGTNEGITSDLQRLRVEAKDNADKWQYFVALDAEAIINDFANTPEFGIIRSKIQNNLASWDADKVDEEDDLYLKASVYRAYVQYFTPQFQATIGKQAVDWGKLRFYSPLDVFNPVGPIDLEPEERVGVDAINLNFSPESFAGLNFVVIPNEDDAKAGYGIRLYKTVSPYDYALIMSHFRDNTTVGFLFDGYIKNAGFRGEISHTKLANGRQFPRAGVGIDYNFNDKWYILAEQFYNGGHEDDMMSTFAYSYLLSREILSTQQHLSSVMVRYTLSPLTELSTAVIYDWEGQSIVVNPQIKHSLSSNTEVAVGVQFFWGDDDSEFGAFEHLIYGEFKWFF